MSNTYTQGVASRRSVALGITIGLLYACSGERSTPSGWLQEKGINATSTVATREGAGVQSAPEAATATSGATASTGEGVPETETATGVGTATPFDLDRNPNEGVTLDPEGALVIGGDTGNLSPYMWIADTNLPGVSKIETDSLQVVARYYTGGSSTSRTAVNARGEAFIGARGGDTFFGAGEGKGGVTKILPGNCPDRNGDGVVRTSTGPDDVLPWGEDECVDWFTEMPGDIRGVAAQDIPALEQADVCTELQGGGDIQVETSRNDMDQHHVWVGGTHGKIYKLDAETGDILLTLDSPHQGNPYGLALSGDGKLWTAQGLAFIDTHRCLDQGACNAEPYCHVDCNETNCSDACDGAIKARFNGVQGYGITVDCKQRVWMTGTTRLDLSLPPSERMRQIPDTGGSAGIAADAEGWVWSGTGREIHRIDQETLEHVAIPAVSKGVAVDGRGRVLGVEMGTQVDLISPGPTLQDFTLTPAAMTLPGWAYAYSDMTGVQTRLASSDPGWYQQRFTGCEEGDTEWQQLQWEVELPEGTWVLFRVRTADSEEDLEGAPWRAVSCQSTQGGVGSAMIDQFGGEMIDVEVRFVRTDTTQGHGCLAAASGASARILNFGATRGCEPPPPEIL